MPLGSVLIQDFEKKNLSFRVRYLSEMGETGSVMALQVKGLLLKENRVQPLVPMW